MKIRLITGVLFFVIFLSSCAEITTGVRYTHFRIASEYYTKESQGIHKVFIFQDIGLKDDNLSAPWTVNFMPIHGFDYEEGYEYVILVRITEGTVLDRELADRDWIRFSCRKVISKEKKDSKVDTSNILIIYPV